jgi:hypothetical protein
MRLRPDAAPVESVLLVADEETVVRYSSRGGRHCAYSSMSGCAEDVLANTVRLVPGAAYLGKPFKLKTLLTKVREILDARPETEME